MTKKNRTIVIICAACALLLAVGILVICLTDGKKEEEGITEVSMNALPIKTDYFVGEALDVRGGSLTVLSDEGENTVSLALAECVCSTNTSGKQTVTVNYEGKSTSFEITVHERANTLEGKNLIFLGDSVTFGSNNLGVSFVDIIEDEHGATCVKDAMSGTCMTFKPTGRPDGSSFIYRMRNSIDALVAARGLDNGSIDHFICSLSTNDASKGYRLGDIVLSHNKDEFDTTTITGSVQYIILMAHELYSCPVTLYTAPRYPLGHAYYKDLVAMLLELREKWDVPFGIIDMWSDDDFNNSYVDGYAAADMIHPTGDGYENWVTPYIVEYLKANTYAD